MNIIQFTPLIIFILALVIFWFICKKYLFGMQVQNQFILALILSAIPLLEAILLTIFKTGVMCGTMIPTFMAGMEPIFIRNLIGGLIQISPILSLFFITNLFRKKEVKFALISGVIFVISIVIVFYASQCIVY